MLLNGACTPYRLLSQWHGTLKKIPTYLDHKGVGSATQYASDVQTSFDDVLISSPLSHQCTDNSILLHMTLLGVSVPDRKKMDWMQKHMFFSVLSKHVQLVWFYLKCCEYVQRIAYYVGQKLHPALSHRLFANIHFFDVQRVLWYVFLQHKVIATDLLVFSNIELSAHQPATFNAANCNEWSVKLMVALCKLEQDSVVKEYQAVSHSLLYFSLSSTDHESNFFCQPV